MRSALTTAFLVIAAVMTLSSCASEEGTSLGAADNQERSTAPTNDSGGTASQEDGTGEAAGAPDPVTCTDPAAIEANAENTPAGLPAGWAEGEALPDPECHPDYIELSGWEYEDSTCMDPIAHGTVDPRGLSEEEYRAAEWEASEARATWTPPSDDEDCSGHGG